MRCPDCQKEVRFHREFCPHCGGELSKVNRVVNKPYGMMNFWVNAVMR